MTPSSPRLVVTRWTKYGKDRLYVSTPDRETVGWQDLLTGTCVLERHDLHDEFQAALAGHAASAATPIAEAAPRMRKQPQPSLLAMPGPSEADLLARQRYDLAANRPGRAVRAQAEALHAQMKAQSRVRTLLARALDAKTEERAFRVGAAGEEAVGPRLERLAKHGWHVLHSIPVGKQTADRDPDIDHLLIGHGGIYTINTKNHPGGRVWVGKHAVRVNGQPTLYLPKARSEAQRVRRVLEQALGCTVPVRPVLILLTGTLIPQVTIKQSPEDVLILDRMDIPRAFRRAPERLTPEVACAVFEVARWSDTWR